MERGKLEEENKMDRETNAEKEGEKIKRMKERWEKERGEKKGKHGKGRVEWGKERGGGGGVDKGRMEDQVRMKREKLGWG